LEFRRVLFRSINHQQGFKLLSEASEVYKWHLNLSEIARIWTNGCIIRSQLMENLIPVLKVNDNILLSKVVNDEIINLKPSLSGIVSECIQKEIPVLCLSEAINYLNAYTQANSAASIIQAQRDYFGAHTYQRNDEDTGEFYHTNWKN